MVRLVIQQPSAAPQAMMGPHGMGVNIAPKKAVF